MLYNSKYINHQNICYNEYFPELFINILILLQHIVQSPEPLENLDKFLFFVC